MTEKKYIKQTWQDAGIDPKALSQQSGNQKIKCPACPPHENKSHQGNLDLSVNIQDEIWHCHRCHWSGKLQWIEVEEEETSKAKSTTDQEFKQPDPISKWLPERVLDWFGQRAISKETLEASGVGFTQRYLAKEQRKVDMIQFPFTRDGELINVKYRTLGKDFQLAAGCERILFGLDSLKGAKVCAIVEGEIDALTLHEAGVSSVVSVPDGAPSPGSKNLDNKFRFLDADIHRFDDIEKVLIAVDNDEPGRLLADELARRIGPERCWFVSWSGGCKDANDVLISYGPEVVSECIEHAQPWPVDGLVSVATIADKIRDIYKNGMPGGEKTGWSDVSRLYTVRRGELTVVTGIPAHGKSLFISALTVNLARHCGWSFTFFSPEHAIERQTITLMQQYAGLPFRSGPSQRMDNREMESALTWVSQHYGFIKLDEDSPSVQQLLELARIDVKRRGISGLVLDPWNEIDHSRSKGQSEQDYISHALSSVRRFAEKYNVHIWLIAHPTKMQKAQSGQYADKYPPPTPYDIASSANFRNKAANCLTVWRDSDADSEEVEIHVQKIKFPEIGRTGGARLHLDKVTGRFSEYEPDYKGEW